jgi:hypothetical protein
VRSQNDLKPRIWTFLSLSKFNSLRARARPSIRHRARVRPGASALRFGYVKLYGLELRRKDEHKPEIALFGRRADYRFDAAETGLPVVYPSGSE